MRIFRHILAALAALCLALTLAPAAFAAEDARFAGKSWDEVTQDFLQELGALEMGRLGIGYYNTVTGEEQYYNADDYITVGSVYKVPLNMIFCERIANGEMTLQSPVYGISYELLLRGTVIDSNNDYAKMLWDSLGGYHAYRRLIAPLMGEDPDNVTWTFYENNLFTPRQMISCLRLLYENPDRFPHLLDVMKQAEPTNYFRRDEHRFEIAHKYGYNEENYHTYVADAGICYTEEPFLLVVYTDNTPGALNVLAQYMTLMCDYTEYHHAARLKDGAVDRALDSLTLPQAPAAKASGAASQQTETPVLNMDEASFAKLVGILTLTLLGLGVCAKLARRGGYLMVLPAVIILAAGLLVSRGLVRASGADFFSAGRDGGRETTDAFFTALETGDFEKAGELLNGYTTVGPENVPSDEYGARANKLLRASYAHRLGSGDAEGSEAIQSVSFTHLSYPKLQDALREETRRLLESYLGEREDSALYDEAWDLLPAVVSEAYAAAFETVTDTAESCYVEDKLTLMLHYDFRGWQIDGAESLVNAICGK